jgi:site-specific DNA-methyltransferase (adenine-specific)
VSLHPDVAAVLAGEKRWALVHADNAEVLPTLPDKAVAHVITDPPYEAEAHTKQRRLAGGDRSDSLVRSAPVSFAAITPEGRAWAGAEIARLAARWTLVFCQVEGALLWRDALEAGGARRMRSCVWVKPNGQPQMTGDRPGTGYEMIAACHSRARSRWNGGGRRGVFEHCVDANFSREPREHETQKPLALMLELVELFTDADEVVLDPFAGSGTTGVACLRLGRRFVGIEKDAKYAAVARERLEAESQGLTLRDARAGQQPLFPVAP